MPQIIVSVSIDITEEAAVDKGLVSVVVPLYDFEVRCLRRIQNILKSK